MIDPNQENAYTYGNDTVFKAEELRFVDNVLRAGTVEIPRLAPLDQNLYHQALHDINATWTVMEDPQSGQQFELAIVNTDASLDDGIDMEQSTFTSSLSGNKGNAVEFAENGASNPDRQRLYVASPGNGKTSYWTREEQRYIRTTGRFTQKDNTPLPTIAALARILEAAELPVTRISTNSAGGAYATALMAALPEGQVSHAYIKSRPNISDHPSGLVWGARVAWGDFIDDTRFKKASKDSWRLTDKMIEMAEEALPRLYSEDEADGAHSMSEAAKTHGLKKMYTDLMALSRGPKDNFYIGAAAHDTRLALAYQPEVLMTFHFPARDKLYAGRSDIERFMKQLRYMGDVAASYSVRSLIVPGAHRDHTQYPTMRRSFEASAFDQQ